MTDTLIISNEHADTVRRWFAERGGVTVWGSLNLSDPGKTWTTPLDGDKPSSYARKLYSLTDPSQVQVVRYREHSRFRVGLRISSTGLYVKLTDGAARRLRRQLDKARMQAEWGEDLVTYRFDYDTQEAVILIPEETGPLGE